VVSLDESFVNWQAPSQRPPTMKVIYSPISVLLTPQSSRLADSAALTII
jgi:hypothetical protein